MAVGFQDHPWTRAEWEYHADSLQRVFSDLSARLDQGIVADHQTFCNEFNAADERIGSLASAIFSPGEEPPEFSQQIIRLQNRSNDVSLLARDRLGLDL